MKNRIKIKNKKFNNRVWTLHCDYNSNSKYLRRKLIPFKSEIIKCPFARLNPILKFLILFCYPLYKGNVNKEYF